MVSRAQRIFAMKEAMGEPQRGGGNSGVINSAKRTQFPGEASLCKCSYKNGLYLRWPYGADMSHLGLGRNGRNNLNPYKNFLTQYRVIDMTCYAFIVAAEVCYWMCMYSI